MDRTMDYTPFLALFENGKLTLSNMTISAEACALLDHIAEAAMSRKFVALPGEQAVELVNRDDVLAHRVPFVQIIADGTGMLSLPACQFRLLPFDIIIERLLPDTQTFEVFASDQHLPYRYAYRRNLSAWQHMDARLVTEYRLWLLRYFAPQERNTKTEALLVYCQLAHQEGFLSQEELDEIVHALEQSRPRRGRRTKTR